MQRYFENVEILLTKTDGTVTDMSNAGGSIKPENGVTGQNLSIVSDTPGTTTDPVSNAMELLPLGPVVITDTAGLDDEGLVGEMRVQKAMIILRKTDIAVLVVDGSSARR